MIQCPECSKDIAENAAHCGHCGAKIPAAGAGMKTMFGFGAISPEMMKKAADEVKAAKNAAIAGAGAVTDRTASVVDSAVGNLGTAADAVFDHQKTIPSPALSLPKSKAPVSGLGGEASSSVFDLNAPGTSKPLDPFAASVPVPVMDVEVTMPTVEPGSVGLPPAGAGDPAWADSSVPTAAHSAPSEMPQTSPQGANLANTTDPKLDWGGTGGPQKESKSKMPFVLLGGCLLLVFFTIFAFVFTSFIWPLL